MKDLFKILFVAVFLTISMASRAQGFELVFHLKAQDSLIAGNTFLYERFYQSAQEKEQAIKFEIKYWNNLSFLTAGIDSSWYIGNKQHILFYIGEKITLAAITYENVPLEILYGAGYNLLKQEKDPASYKAINRINGKILTFYENNGYPFAQLSLKSVASNNKGVILNYTLDTYKKQTFDSIIITGDLEVNKKFLENYLEIKEGEEYKETAFGQIDRKLKALSFVQLTAPTELYFSNEKAHVIIHANKRKSDKINGLIGFAPNSNNKEKGLLLTGEFDLELHNLFKSAKEFSLNWKSFLERSQKLETKVGIPYIFSSPIGVGARFNLFKSDTFFFNTNTKISLDYLISSGDKMGFFFESLNTNLLYIDTAQIRNTRLLPQINSVKTNYYGLEFSRSRLDYPFNPRKGLSLHFSGAMGIKKIIENKDIRRIKFTENGETKSIYDDLKLKFNQYNLSTKIEYYLPLGKSSTFLFSGTGQTLIADKIYVNEQIRLGGFNNLRGFDEESIYATTYGLINMEYRYLLGLNSFLQFFWNGAYVKNDATDIPSLKEDTPFGFGAGISFETKGGIFNIAYALGRQQNNPIDFRTAKVHFGLTGYF